MKVALVQFQSAGKKYYFDPKDILINKKDLVVVETIRGVEIGFVYDIKEIEKTNITTEIKPIMRIADEKDILEDKYNKTLENDVVSRTKELVKKNKLDMKVLSAEYTLDRKKVVISFESEDRVDFRNLVKDLSEIYHTRIELRQIGPRDGAKLLGGLGPCGLILCCQTFIGEFENVSIKMAKNQNISLNPQKISGVCGKLLCCIKYEDQVYTELKVGMPNYGDKVTTEKGNATVIAVNILRQRVKVKYNDEGMEWIQISEIQKPK